VIQPSPFCNLDCDYCYLPSRSETHRMSGETLRSVVSGIFATDLVRESLTFVWHAGEPMAVPIEWYRSAFDLIQSEAPPGLKSSIRSTSNRTLIDAKWCDFIKETGICLGLSVDGPGERSIMPTGRPAREKGPASAPCAGWNFCGRTGSTSTSSRSSPVSWLDHADEIYDFFTGNGIVRFGFNIEEQEGIHTTSSLGIGTNVRVRSVFPPDVRDARKPAGGAVRVTRIRFCASDGSSATARPPGQESVYENEPVRPFGILSVDWQGNFSTFSPEMLGLSTAEYGTFAFGSFRDGGSETALSNQHFLASHERHPAGVKSAAGNAVFFIFAEGALQQVFRTDPLTPPKPPTAGT